MDDSQKSDRQDTRLVAMKSRRELFKAGAGVLFLLTAGAESAAGALSISNHYSPKNRTRPRRPESRYIILHTTEGAELGSLRKIARRGEAHYFVSENGRVFRIIDKSLIATHAGRSIWDGRKTLDLYSIGIEVVGYHNQDITAAQYEALRELLRQLKSLYKIADHNILTHSMVAYGRPNRFHPYNHRGRKRCAMIFARDDVRRRLGLDDKPLKDPDVEARKIRVADAELYDFLYRRQPDPVQTASVLQTPDTIGPGLTAWTIARERYDDPETIYEFPGGQRLRGNEITEWDKIPAGTRVLVDSAEAEGGFEGFLEVGEDGERADAIAGEAAGLSTTIYFLPNGLVRTGKELGIGGISNLPRGTRILLGYIYGGHVRNDRLPVRIAGHKWNYPSTYYRFPDGTIISGDEVDPSSIPPNTLVFYQS